MCPLPDYQRKKGQSALVSNERLRCPFMVCYPYSKGTI